MEPYRTEVHSLFLRPFLDEAHERLGAERVAALLGSLGVEESRLRDETAWVSLALCERLFSELLAATGDPAIFDRCGRLALTPRYAGVMRTIARSVGSPATVYRAIVGSLTPRFNKVGEYHLEERGRGSLRLTYTPKPGASREASDLVCRSRAAQLAAIPTMFDLPAGEVTHARCMHEGAPACVYDIRWTPARSRAEPVFGALAGALLGGGATVALGGAPAWVAGFAVVSAGMGGALGRARRLGRELDERNARIAAQQDEVLRAVEANELRYQELLEAKGEVDRQVSERTAELRSTSEKLASTLAEVRALDAAKTDFFNNVSHELRTPLTLVLGGLDAALEAPGLSEAQRQRLQPARRNAERLFRLINQILDLARVDAGEERLRRATVDVGALAHDVRASFSDAVARRGVSLDVSAPPAPVLASLDPRWVESALVNLVANALRFVEPGGRVTIEVAGDPDGIRLAVEDDGPGLSKAAQESIFERFAQAPGTKGGTGLGLAIVREAARLHGGRATVQSDPGEGARFELHLPHPTGDDARRDSSPGLLPSTRPGGAERADAPERRSLPTVTPPEPSRPPPKPRPGAPLVLVVEDGDDLRDHLAHVLGAHYRVLTAADGERGLELALARRPDAIVSDVMMPKLDGIALCRALRAEPRTRTTPVLLLTARTGHDQIVEGFEAGADDYVVKPFRARELLARLGVHVRLRQLVSEAAHAERLATIGMLAASVAHEVRNPLTALSSGLGALRRRWTGKLDAATDELLDVLIDGVGRIERVTRDLLDLSRVDRAEVDRFRPADGLRSAIRLMRTRVGERVTIEEALDEDAEAVGRPGDLNQVLLNLIDNALRALGDEGVLRVGTTRVGSEVLVVVEDSGPGVPEEEIDQVFQPFYSTRRPGEGTGLGLAIARDLVERQGGSIRLERSPLGGARFEIRIPSTPCQDVAVR